MKKENEPKNHVRAPAHTHTSHGRWLLATFIAIIMLPMIGKSQSTCATAENDSPGTNTQGLTRFFSSNDYWLTFLGDSTLNYYIETNFIDSLSYQNPMQISLYRGGCNDLTLIKTDSIPITYDSLQTGTNYYVKIHSKQDSVSFRLYSVFIAKNLATNCDSTSCDILRNGNFTFMNPVVTGENSYDPFWLINWICKWGSIGSQFHPRRHPSATTGSGALDDGYAYMWTQMVDSVTSQQYDWNEVISQVTFIPQGTYDVSLAYKKTDSINLPANHLLMNIVPGNVSTVPTTFNGTILNAPTLAIDVQNIDNYFNWEYHTNEFTIPQSGIYTVEVLPFNTQNQGMASWVSLDNIHITPKPTAQILDFFCKPNMSFKCVLNGCHPIHHVDWNFGDNTPVVTTQGQSIVTHQYSSENQYVVTATIYYSIYNSPAIASITQTRLISLADIADTLDITGNRNTCDSIVTYSAVNSFPGTSCTWTITPSNAGTILVNDNHSITINWHENNMTNGQPVTLNLNDGLCSKSIDIWKCCKDSSGIATILNDETITTNITSGTYYLNGTISVNGNVTISKAIFNMAPEAKIQINSPSVLNINYTTIKAGCNYMWNGIYNKSPHSNLNTLSSTLQDAQNAIVSENGGYVSVSNTLFNLNNYGIKVLNSNVPNPLNVSNCKFYCTTDGTGTTPRNLIAPLTDFIGFAGIDINNVSSIQVGDINKATKNKFSFTAYGININNSNVAIYNNNFVNFPVVNSAYGAGIAIMGNNNTTRTSVIGGYNSGNNVYSNLFSNCRIAIYQQYQANIKVLCDTFVNSSYMTIKIASNSNRNIDFTKNRIENTLFGLYVTDFINTRLIVDSNSVFNVTNGFTFQNTTLQECFGATIRKNIITGSFKNGIQLTNVKGRSLIPIGPPGYERQIPYLYNNTITFGSYDIVGNNFYTGIYITNGDNTYIEDNIINTPTYTVASESQGLKLNGIYVIASPRTNLCSNTITNLGMGIRFAGLCTASPIKSNSINNNYYGVRLENATIGNQGVTTVRWVNRNSWTYPFVAGRYRVQGSMATTTTWTYDGPNTSNYSLLSNEYSVTGGLTTSSISIPVPQTCSGYDGVIWIPYNGGGGGDSDAMINGAQSSELAAMPTFTVDIEENQYYQASAFYANTQPENLNMSVSENAELTDNPIQTTSIPQFDQVNKLISANRIDEAIAVNDAIAPINLIEKNHKIANGIYLQSWAKGRFELTDDERATLLQIATQPHIQGGYGVITAWVMLNRIYRTEPINQKNSIKPFGIHNNESIIYPNPAQEQITIKGALDIAYAIIYDIQGRELLKTPNSVNSNEFFINTSKLSKGVYFIKLIRSDLSDEKIEKLIIE